MRRPLHLAWSMLLIVSLALSNILPVMGQEGGRQRIFPCPVDGSEGVYMYSKRNYIKTYIFTSTKFYYSLIFCQSFENTVLDTNISK